MSDSKPPREQWGSKVGAILAVAGSAVGLGNFLRFPGNAAQNGGGAFMIPYFISLVLLGIPICWVEWTLGREGGRLGFNSSPGIFYALVKNRFVRLFSAVAVLIPVAIYMYYGVIEAWCLSYALDYLMGRMDLGVQVDAYTKYFEQFVGMDADGLTDGKGAINKVVYFVLIVFVANYFLIYKGVTKGIERFCRVAMPILILCAVAVLVRVLTLPEQPLPEPWPYALREALSGEKWQQFRGRLDGLIAAAEAAETGDPALSKEKNAAALEAARAAVPTAVMDAVSEYHRGLARKEKSERAEVALASPYGFAATYEGVKLAWAEASDGAAAEARRQWVKEAREKLDHNAKWDLMHYEEVEGSALAALADESKSEKEKEAARENVKRAQDERRAKLETIGLPPNLGDEATSNGRLRLAAFEAAELRRTVANGLGFMWNPRTAKGGDSILRALADPQVWLNASSQIFFSLSVGFGIIVTYSSYLRRRDDVVLSGLTAASVNETCEVALGGLITLPAAFIFLGMAAMQSPTTFSLGFFSLPAVFAQMPGGRWVGFIWYAALFLAAITSSVSMLQPAIAFLEEGFGLKRRSSVALLGLLTALGALMVTHFSKGLVALDMLDIWVGNLCIFVLATVTVLLFSWVIGAERGRQLANEGAHLKLPRIFGFVVKYVSPVYLLAIFVFWSVQTAPTKVREVLANDTALFTVLFAGLMLLFFVVLVGLANARWTAEGRDPHRGAP